jgi:RNA polymerase subunit RPABC4/transcription elongation factor Spt4
VIPFGGWLAAGIVFLLFFLLFNLMFLHNSPPLPVRILIPIVVPLMLAGYTLLIGYVNGDARRRGMRYVMWTLLAIFLANGIGIILYFILRDPLPVHCTRCGASVLPTHAFCPRCGAGVQPACQACHRILQPGWTHCAWCGNRL